MLPRRCRSRPGDVGQGDGVVMGIGNKLIVSDVGEHKLDAVNSALEKLNWRGRCWSFR
jgi:hypothetical protein